MDFEVTDVVKLRNTWLIMFVYLFHMDMMRLWGNYCRISNSFFLNRSFRKNASYSPYYHVVLETVVGSIANLSSSQHAQYRRRRDCIHSRVSSLEWKPKKKKKIHLTSKKNPISLINSQCVILGISLSLSPIKYLFIIFFFGWGPPPKIWGGILW